MSSNLDITRVNLNQKIINSFVFLLRMKFKIPGFFLMILAISLILMGCTTEEKSSSAEIEISTTPYVTEKTTKPTFSQETTAILAKGAAITNYHYFFNSLVRNSGGNYDQTTVPHIHIKDNLQKKSWSGTKRYEDNLFYDQVYLDSDSQTATAVCSSVSAVSCADLQNKAFSVSFVSQEVVYLNKLVTNLPADAKMIGKETIDNRKSIIIEYSKGKYTEKLSIDEYYGLPLQRILYTIENENQVTLEKDSYTLISVGNVKNSDVTLPSKYNQT